MEIEMISLKNDYTPLRAFARVLEIDRDLHKIVRKESMIARRLISDAIKAGMTVSVHDGEEITVRLSSSVSDVLRAMRTVDEEHLLFYQGGNRIGSVFFCYGNDGWDVINDYSTSLESVVAGANELADRLCN